MDKLQIPAYLSGKRERHAYVLGLVHMTTYCRDSGYFFDGVPTLLTKEIDTLMGQLVTESDTCESLSD